MGRIAAWADAYRKEPEGRHTTTWHWINGADDPPRFCNLYLNRDCTSDGCIVAALGNQTQILKGCIKQAKFGRLNTTETKCANAVKFITHFTQDIAQPLHVTGQARGGNDHAVVFGGEKTNLHAIWDGRIVYTLANVTKFSTGGIDPYFENLVERLRADTLFVPRAEMTACSDPGTPTACALAWARDANEWNCDYAFSQDFNATDLLTSGYAAGAWPIAEIQIAKAIVRIATWFNKLVENCYHERDVVLDLVPSWVGGPNSGA